MELVPLGFSKLSRLLLPYRQTSHSYNSIYLHTWHNQFKMPQSISHLLHPSPLYKLACLGLSTLYIFHNMNLVTQQRSKWQQNRVWKRTAGAELATAERVRGLRIHKNASSWLGREGAI